MWNLKPWVKRTVFGAVGGVMLLGGLVACGHRHHGPWTDEQVLEMRGKAVERIGGKLDLNDAQKLKLTALADELIAQRKALRGTSADPKAEFSSLIAGAQFDRSKAQALLSQKTEAVQGNGPKVITALADFYDSLNPEQQAKVRGYLNERRHGGWWNRG